MKQIQLKDEENKRYQDKIEKLLVDNKKMKDLEACEREGGHKSIGENKLKTQKINELESNLNQRNGELEFVKQEKKEIIGNMCHLERLNQEYKDEINKMKLENNKIVNELKTQIQNLDFQLIKERDNHEREIERVKIEFDKKQVRIYMLIKV